MATQAQSFPHQTTVVTGLGVQACSYTCFCSVNFQRILLIKILRILWHFFMLRGHDLKNSKQIYFYKLRSLKKDDMIELLVP